MFWGFVYHSQPGLLKSFLLLYQAAFSFLLSLPLSVLLPFLLQLLKWHLQLSRSRLRFLWRLLFFILNPNERENRTNLCFTKLAARSQNQDLIWDRCKQKYLFLHIATWSTTERRLASLKERLFSSYRLFFSSSAFFCSSSSRLFSMSSKFILILPGGRDDLAGTTRTRIVSSPS